MESRVKLLGHPIHPMLIVFPRGLLARATIFAIAFLITGNTELSTFSFWALVAGIIGGLLAAVFGFLDWLPAPPGTAPKRVGGVHGVGNLVVTALFAAGLATRWSSPAYLPNVLPAVFTILGTCLALF